MTSVKNLTFLSLTHDTAFFRGNPFDAGERAVPVHTPFNTVCLPLHTPFNTVCLPLDHSGNPGATDVSNRGGVKRLRQRSPATRWLPRESLPTVRRRFQSAQTNPFKAVDLPLSRSGNPGVHGVSHGGWCARETPGPGALLVYGVAFPLGCAAAVSHSVEKCQF